MKFLRPLVIGLLPVLHTAVFLLLPWAENYILWVIPAVFLLTDVLLLAVTPPRASWSVRLSTTIPSIFLVLSSLGIYVFLEDSQLVTRIAVIAGNALMQAVYLFNLYNYSYRPKHYQERSLSNTSDYMNMLTVFYTSCVLFASVFFIDVPIWYLIPPFLLVIMGVTTQSFWIDGISIKSQGYMWAAMPIIMTELLYVLLWLPSIYYVNALVVVVWYTALIHLSVSSARRELEQREITTTIIIALVVVLLPMLTALWR